MEVQKYKELEDVYRKGELHPADLKIETIEILDEIIKPIREHFEKDKKANNLYKVVKEANVTR